MSNKKAPSSSQDKLPQVGMPSAQTLFHVLARDATARAAVEHARAMLSPLLQLRDRNNVQQIKNSKSAEELVGLAPAATGLAEALWYARLREFGPEIVPLMARQLEASKRIPEKKKQELATERLVTALRWQGKAGAQALVGAFDSLQPYGQSLACIALGLLKYKPAADIIWFFYQRVAHRPESYLVGALWGLIDLQDRRAGEALVDLLRAGDRFEELYGFLARAGDVRAIEPLITIIQPHGAEAEEASMALVCIAHRLGRQALMAELERVTEPSETRAEREETADQLLGYPREAAEKYFDLYFHSVQFDDVAKAFGHFM